MDLKSGEKINTLSNYRPEEAVSEGITARELLRIVTKKKDEEIHTFIPPISLKERLFLEAYKLLDDLTEFDDVIIPLKTTHIPLKWTLVLEFLRKQGIAINKNVPFYRKMENDAPKRFMVQVQADIQNVTDGTTWSWGVLGCGIAENQEHASAKAMGEFLERFFLLTYRRKNLLFSDTKTLKNKKINFLEPKTLQFFTPEQRSHFPKKCGYPEGVKFGWVKGMSLLENIPVWLPAQLVYWNYNRQYDGQEEPMLMEQNTNGGAGQFSRDKAILSGLRELIERDAFLIHWLLKVPPRRIAQDSIQDEKIQKLLHEFSQFQYQVELCDVTLDMGERAVTVVVIDRSHLGPTVIVAGACHTNIIVAIHKALLEALLCCHGQRMFDVNKTLPDTYQPFFDDRVGHNERSALSSNPKNFDQYAWFITGEIYTLTAEENNQTMISDDVALNDLIQIFKEKNKYIYYYEVTHKTLAYLQYHVVKVIIPSLVPFYLIETHAPLNHPRLHEEIPEYIKSKITEKGFNTIPHPFP